MMRVDSGPVRIGNFPRGVVGPGGVFGQGVQRELLPERVEEFRLPPAFEQTADDRTAGRSCREVESPQRNSALFNRRGAAF